MRPLLTKKNVAPYVDALKTRIFDLLAATGTNWRGQEFIVSNNGAGALIVGVVFANDDGYFASVWFWVVWDAQGEIVLTQYQPQTYTPESFPKDKMPPPDEYVGDWIRNVYHEVRRRRLAKKVSSIIRQELVAAVWHPRRVARLLELGGWDAVEGM